MVAGMEVKWEEELLHAAHRVLIRGGSVVFEVSKRDNKRIPVVKWFPEDKVVCKEVEIVD